ncbi:MAG: TCR/Tet family MFS transporter [Caulobacteraceae bacterium]|nr:TCR/Tet family MFS transporter [Caulobacter sp.]
MSDSRDAAHVETGQATGAVVETARAPRRGVALLFASRASRHAGVPFILMTALIDIVAIGIIIPVLPPLVVSFVGNEARGAQIYGYFGAAFSLMQFIFSPIQGALSDRFGRRPVLLVSIFGLGCDFVFMALAPNLVWLFLGRLVSGMTAASFSTANAYIADLYADETDEAKRAGAFGLMGTVFSVGFIIGPGLGGLLAHLGPRAPFWAAACFSLANGLYGLFVLPESLPLDRREPFSLRNANPVASIGIYRTHPQLPRFAVILMLFYLAVQVFISSFVLYVGYRYHWGPTLVGAALMASGAASTVVQWTLIKPFVKRFGERTAIYTGFAFGTAALLIYATAPVGWLYWFGVPFAAMSGLIMPGLQGVMTRRVPRTMQGRLQGANAGIMAMAGLVGPIFFTSLFAWSISGGRHMPGLALYVAAGLYVAALVITLGAPRLDRAAAP